MQARRRPRIAEKGLLLLRSLGKAAWGRPRTTILLALLLLVTGLVSGGYAYALHQWSVAQAAVKEGRLPEAHSSLAVCLWVWPRSVPVHLLAARAARLTGDIPGAEAHLNQCLKLQHGSTDAIQLEFLLMRVQTGEVDEVTTPLMVYVDNKHPETPLILETICGAYIHDLRYGPAFSYLNRWIHEEPDAPQPLFWRGWVLEHLHLPDDAMKDYLRAVEVKPDFVPSRLRVAEKYLEESNPPAALPHLEWLREHFPDRADVMARLGKCRFLQGQKEEARQLMEAAVEKLPNDADLLVHLAKLDLQEDRAAEAEQWMRRLLKVEPHDPEGQYTLVASLQQQGRTEEAAAAMDRYLKSKADMERANLLLKELAQGAAGGPDVTAEVGTLLLRIGQDRYGLYWLHDTLKHDPDHQAAHKALAEYYESKGEAEKAAAHRSRIAGPGQTSAP